MVKNPESVYRPNTRKGGWFKVKPEYVGGELFLRLTEAFVHVWILCVHIGTQRSVCTDLKPCSNFSKGQIVENKVFLPACWHFWLPF